MNSALWATPADRERIARARSAVLMVGSYDGSGNYGDVLQFAAALRTVRGLPGSPLPIAIVERATLDHHRVLLERHPELFEGAAFGHFDDAPAGNGDGLVRLDPGSAPQAAVVHLYGGGYLNHWWGERKAGLVAAAEGLAGASPLPLVGSGLQVEAAAAVPGGSVHGLLSRAAHLGARDIRTSELLREGLDSRAPVELAGDDAIPLLDAGGAVGEQTVNLHLNSGHWVGADPGRVARLLSGIAEAAGRPLRLRPLIAYEDPRVSEAEQVEGMLREHGEDLRRSGLTPTEPTEALADATRDGFAAMRRARLTVSCSYHVALTSLLAGIPAVLLAENGYYDQKAAGLRHLFRLEPGMVGVPGTEEDAASAAEALEEGDRRAALVSHLRARAAELRVLQARGRESVAAALESSLRPRRRGRARSLIRRLGG